MPRTLALAVLLVMSCPATALAGTATVGEIVTDPKYGSTEPALYYTGAAGERNAIGVVRDGSAVVLRDDGATPRPGNGCAALDARTVTCSAPTGPFGTPTLSIVIDAGDGDDTVIVPALADARGGTSVRGGDGADT
ncbi:MAG: hypothetical protein QOG56_468, partial [Solirubrobacteraceae bacterium]|nr:hypothetical protein [Solirubrobacteraceae bacterium]